MASGYCKGLAAGQDPRRQARAIRWPAYGAKSRPGAAWERCRNAWPPCCGAGCRTELAPTNIIGEYLAQPVFPLPDRTRWTSIRCADLLEREIDFEAIARTDKLKVFVSATHVRTGRAVIFSGKQLTAQAVMASACLPMLFKAVEIDGEHYWDGGYSVNPALSPLIDRLRQPPT